MLCIEGGGFEGKKTKQILLASLLSQAASQVAFKGLKANLLSGSLSSFLLDRKSESAFLTCHRS